MTDRRWRPIMTRFALNDKAPHHLEIRKVVENNISSNLTVEELAFLCHLSPSTFKRNFARIYHTTPINWFLEQRMKMAAGMLRLQKEKPSEIFYRLGYENHSSFTKAFRKFYGVSPSEFEGLNVQEQVLLGEV